MLDWMGRLIIRLDMAVTRFFVRLRCDEDGHPITLTCSEGWSGCACGKVKV